MQSFAKTENITLFFMLFTVILSLFIPTLFKDISAASSFSRQEIKDPQLDLIHPLTGTHSNEEIFSPADIRSITYFSDGERLQAILWLNAPPIKDTSPPPYVGLKYGILFDADYNNGTGFNGIEYQQELEWRTATQLWKKTFIEWSPDGKKRIITVDNVNYTQFFVKNEPYTMLSTTPEDITLPDKYRVMFYAELSEGLQEGLKRHLDFSSYVDIPPLKYVLSTSPDPVVLRQGEEEKASAQLKSTIGFVTENVNFTDFRTNPHIIIEFVELPQAFNEAEPASFIVRVSADAQKAVYTLPILANISTESSYPLAPSLYDRSFSKQWSRTEQVNLTVKVLGPMTFGELFKDFWNTYGDLMSLIAGGFTAGAAALTLEWLRNRRKKSAMSFDTGW